MNYNSARYDNLGSRMKAPTTTRRFVLASLSAMSLGVSRSTRASKRPVRRDYDFDGVREGALAAVDTGKATGLAMAALHGGEIVWAEGFGWANRKANLKATPHTPFSVASVSKPFTTTAVATLAAEGKLALDEPANKYLGQVPLRGIESSAVTVRQLGAHAAGLPPLFEMFPVAGDMRPPSVEALLLAYGRLAFPPGRLYEYSNIGYAALAAIGSRLTEQSLGAIITRRVLEPLGLRDSFFGSDRARLVQAATGYDELDRPIPYYSTATPASGEVYASAHDLAQFANFNLKNRTVRGQTVLSGKWIDELHAPVLHGPAAGATTFGWFSGRSQSGLPVLFKDGGQPGVSTTMCLVPSENLACVVLANRTDNGDLVQKLVDQMIAAVLPGWTTPDTRMNARTSPFFPEPPYVGQWSGKLSGGGADATLELEIPARAPPTLAINAQPAARVTDLQIRGPALIGTTTGSIEGTDAARNQAKSLSLELLPYQGSLVGRILAGASGPGRLAAIPFTVTLDRPR